MKKHIMIWALVLLALWVSVPEVVAKEKQEKKPVPEFPFKKFYADVSLGYGFPLGAVHLNGSLLRELCPSGIDLKDRRFSFGNGLNIGMNFGCKFNKYLAIDIGGSYMAYPTMDNVAWRHSFVEERDSLGYLLRTAVAEDHMGVFSESGNISVQLAASPGFNRVDPYVKAGMVFSVAHIHGSQNYTVYEGNAWWEPAKACFQQSFSGSQWDFRVGFIGVIGMNVNITPLISFLAEWQFSVSSFVILDWGDLKQTSEKGDKEVARELLDAEPQRYTGIDYLTFNSHGLRIGVKFKF